MIPLLLRLAIFIALIGCIFLIPYCLFWLSAADKRKQQAKREEATNELYDYARNTKPIVKKTIFSKTSEEKAMDETFSFIEERHHKITQEKEWLCIESAHGLTDTFNLDLERYKTLYFQLKDKSSVEEKVTHSIQVLNQRLDAFEKEIEDAKKVALYRQGYIIEKRKEKH